MSYLDDALAYAARGWSILPVKQKRPAVRSWKRWQTTRPTESMLQVWFVRTGLDGMAVVCGSVSGGLVVRDFDSMRAYDRWANEHPDLAATLPTVETARGRHVYFRDSVDRIIEVRTNGVHEGELRGGGIAVLPPSRHPSGKTYRWVVALTDLPLLELDAVEAGLLTVPPLPPDHLDVQQRGQRQQSQRSKPKTTEDMEGESVGKNPHHNDQTGRRVRTGTVSSSVLADKAVDDAICRTLPARVGQRNRAIFELCRALQGIPAVCDADPKGLRSVVKRWHELALPAIGTKPFEESWIDFLRAWPKVKYPHGAGPMDQIFETAKTAEWPTAAMSYDQPGVRLLVALCRELQRCAGKSPFYLDCRTAGRLLGVEHTTAWRWLFLLESDGLLLVTERGGQSGKRRRATRYLYIGDGVNQK